MVFFLKKFISQFLMPMPLVCECFLLGWILMHFTKYKKTGKCFSFLAFLLFLLFGYGFGRTYLYNLERRYPPFDSTSAQCEALRGAFVLVLGQGMPAKSDLPLRYQNNPVFERRLFEGVRVAKLIPESRLIVSMAGEASDSVKHAFLDEYMILVNFSTNRVSMFTTARDTADEAKLAKNCLIRYLNPTNAHSLILGGVSPTDVQSRNRTNELSKFRTNVLILASSASHIPRAMKIFQKQGMSPIAAPCDYSDAEKPRLIMRWFEFPFPSGSNIELANTFAHEWLGELYEKRTK